MDTVEHEESHLRGVMAERRKLNWSAIWAGIAATLGVFVLLFYLGAALGLALFDPLQGTLYAMVFSWPALAWLAFSVIAASFFGSWVSGHWANLYDSEDAVIHGTLTWSLSLLFATLAISLLLQASAQRMPAAALAGTGQSAIPFNALDDPRFTSFLIQEAVSFASSLPVPVTADRSLAGKQEPAGQAPVLNTTVDIEHFVVNASNLDQKQAREFIAQHKADIEAAMQESHKRWLQAHVKELTQAEANHARAMAASWTLFGLAVLALFAAVGGSFFGWTQRYDDLIEEEKLGASE